MQALLDLAVNGMKNHGALSQRTPSRKNGDSKANNDSQTSPIKIALFALGTMCAHSEIRAYIRANNALSVLHGLKRSGDTTMSKYVVRILGKFSEFRGAT